ncbi:MAG TPA: glycosyltransferase family 1 protein [Candidatus Saccharimonadales bacterium]
MNELATRFALGSSIFVSWDGRQHRYTEINLDQLGEQPPAPVVSERSGFVETARKIRRRLPIPDKILTVSERAIRKLLTTTPPNYSDLAPSIALGRGDVLFVLADWHGSDPEFVKYLIDLNATGVKLVQMVYDLLPIVTPQYSGHATESLTVYSKAIYPLCDLILAISQHTKKDVASWLRQNKLAIPKIEVIRLGDDFELASPVKPGNAYFDGSDKKFLLCVGTIEARKNHTLLYYTYKLAIQKGIELPDLIIVGRRGWKSDDIYEMMTKDPEIKSKFIILEKTSDEELSWLYEHCLFNIYPSFYEGWGLPIAESIAHGAACICSNTSSMPEIAGDLITYFSPYSTEECLKAIQNILKPGAIAAAKRRIKAYRPVSWDETAALVKESIKELHVKD